MGLVEAACQALFEPFDRARIPLMGASAVVTTGVGSSLAHARYLAHLLRTGVGIPAWDVSTGVYVTAPGAEARDQVLVVFSQGLSPNARWPLAYIDRYRATVLVTAASAETGDRAAALRAAVERGALVVPLGCAPEYEVLIRLIGPLLGFAVAHRVAGAPIAASAPAVREALHDAAGRASAAFAEADRAIFSDPITFVAVGGYAGLAHNLCAKVQEGMFLTWPVAVDALELAHGTQQEASGKPRTFIALGRGAAHEAALFARVRATLAPQHRWLALDARLPGTLSIFEHELMVNELVLAAIAARRLDQCDWPGKGGDGPLYAVAGPSDLVAAPPSPAAPK